MSTEHDAAAGEHAYPPVQGDVKQFTLRAVGIGMLLGGMLSLCNVYLGLKIGWGFNMSITAALLGFATFYGSHKLFGTRPFGVLENNMNQTAASAAASISSAGLVAPIPALTMLTDYEWSYGILVAWTLSVSLVGVVTAIGLRKQMLIVDALPFPGGVATGETLKEIYAEGKEALARVKMLLAGMFGGAALKVVNLVVGIPKLAIPGKLAATGALAGKGYKSISLKNLGFAIDPSAMMIAVGAIIGFRACVSILLGAVISWVFVAPYVLDLGWASPGKNDPSAMWFGPVVKWMLWPGVALMVSAALTSFSFSWRSMLRAFTGSKKTDGQGNADPASGFDVPKKVFIGATVAVFAVSVLLQGSLFDVGLDVAAVGVVLTFALAIVAGRVSGETGITPVGPMGKVTQLALGAVDPGNATSNLMAANVTGGAASQCADMLHDLKSGLMLGAVPKLQILSQTFGVLAGALAGSAVYLVLIPDPKNQLLTEEWAAPAVAQWKAVAEVFAEGVSAMPEGAISAFIIAAIIGVVMAIMEKTLPEKVVKWVPSPSAMGLALVIPVYYSISFFIGGLLFALGKKFADKWTTRFAIVLAAGIIAGESLAGVGDAIVKVVRGLSGG